MNIFVAGIHGVGKTYLASRLPTGNDLLHTSASKLIEEERALPGWSSDKRVSDIHENQLALVNAVARHNSTGRALLLDGHFVLLGQRGQFVALGQDVFKALNLSAVVLIEEQPAVVARRMIVRDNSYQDAAWIEEFTARERSQAELICQELHLPVTILNSPSQADFANAVFAATQCRDRT